MKNNKNRFFEISARANAWASFFIRIEYILSKILYLNHYRAAHEADRRRCVSKLLSKIEYSIIYDYRSSSEIFGVYSLIADARAACPAAAGIPSPSLVVRSRLQRVRRSSDLRCCCIRVLSSHYKLTKRTFFTGAENLYPLGISWG